MKSLDIQGDIKFYFNIAQTFHSAVFSDPDDAPKQATKSIQMFKSCCWFLRRLNNKNENSYH